MMIFTLELILIILCPSGSFKVFNFAIGSSPLVETSTTEEIIPKANQIFKQQGGHKELFAKIMHYISLFHKCEVV